MTSRSWALVPSYHCGNRAAITVTALIVHTQPKRNWSTPVTILSYSNTSAVVNGDTLVAGHLICGILKSSPFALNASAQLVNVVLFAMDSAMPRFLFKCRVGVSLSCSSAPSQILKIILEPSSKMFIKIGQYSTYTQNILVCRWYKKSAFIPLKVDWSCFMNLGIFQS